MSRQNIKQAKRYQPSSQNQNLNESSNQNQNLNQDNNEAYDNNNEQSPNELKISPAAQKILDTFRRARATRSNYMVLESNTIYRLQFDITKSKIEKKTFNEVTSERIAYSVINLDDPDKLEKILSLTFKQSKPIEEIIQQGYTVMDVTKIGEGFSLIYQIEPIE
jgi:hypothetical protein